MARQVFGRCPLVSHEDVGANSNLAFRRLNAEGEIAVFY
jgi:hypothetical protein